MLLPNTLNQAYPSVNLFPNGEVKFVLDFIKYAKDKTENILKIWEAVKDVHCYETDKKAFEFYAVGTIFNDFLLNIISEQTGMNEEEIYEDNPDASVIFTETFGCDTLVKIFNLTIKSNPQLLKEHLQLFILL